MELNACILLLALMVFLLPKHSLGYYYIQLLGQFTLRILSDYIHISRPLCTCIQIGTILWRNPLAFCSPCQFPFYTLLYSLLLTWKPSLL
jgi:hypothetical protein